MKGNVSKGVVVAHVLVYGAFIAICCFLFYMQGIGAYDSDLAAHIKFALDPEIETYSFNSMLLAATFNIAGFAGVAILEAAIEVATIAVTEYLLVRLCPRITPAAALFFAVSLNIAICIYIPFVHGNMYLGTTSGNLWHNSTYSLMRLFALVAIVCFLRIRGRIGAGSNILDWIVFALCVFIAATIKPSFYTILAPSILIVCIVDLVRHGTKTVPRSLLFGLSLAIPLVVIALQYEVLFGAGAEGGNSIAVGFADVWVRRNPLFPLAMLQSYAFPIVVFAACRKRLKDDSNYRLALSMFLIGLAEYLFLYETGDRFMHGNFGWALSFGLYYLMIASVVVFLDSGNQMVTRLFLRENEGEGELLQSNVGGSPAPSNRFVYLSLVLFGLHVLSGVVYLAFLLAGVSFSNVESPFSLSTELKNYLIRVLDL